MCEAAAMSQACRHDAPEYLDSTAPVHTDQRLARQGLQACTQWRPYAKRATCLTQLSRVLRRTSYLLLAWCDRPRRGVQCAAVRRLAAAGPRHVSLLRRQLRLDRVVSFLLAPHKGVDFADKLLLDGQHFGCRNAINARLALVLFDCPAAQC